ncbi:MAG: TetR/AcrR family transcriptional regulator [Rhodothermaceae bacterium]
MNTREKLLNTSLQLFSRLGYSGTSIRKIAKETGIRESAIYNHFPSKKEIFIHTQKLFLRNFNDSSVFTDDLLNNLSNPFKFLTDVITELVKKWETNESKLSLKLLLLSQDELEDIPVISIKERLDDSKAIWKMIFGELIKAGYVKEIDLDQLVNQFYNPLFTLRIQYLNMNSDSFLEEAKSHLDFFWNAVKSEA